MVKFLDLILVTLATSILLFFNKHNLIVSTLLLTICIRLILSFVFRESLLKKFLIFLSVFLSIYLLIADNHQLIMNLTSVLVLLNSILLIYDLFSTKPIKGTFLKFILNTFILLITNIYILLAFFTLFPRNLSLIGPPILKGNVEGIRESYISKNNHLIHKNINYPSPYENSRLDIYQTKNPKGTLFFIHGGGYVVYDKSHRIDYLMRFVNAGYNVVNINYSLFPNNSYPDTTKQVLDAYSFIINNAEIFNIDKNKIFLSGDSAGGQLAGQLTLLLTNQEYRKNINISVSDKISQTKPLGFIGIATMFDITKANQTDSPPINWLFDTVLRDYFDTDDLKFSNKTKEASILYHVNQNFPATFISDGNLATFDEQAKEFHNKLLSYNIDSNLYLIKTDSILQHGFELDVDNPYSQIVFEKQVEFMDKQLKKT